MNRAVQPGTARPGGRTAKTREAVCRATLLELAERGYPALTVDRVAGRSGVHKTTVYRRWGGVEGLIVDALNFAVDDDWQPDTSGTVEENLLALVQDALQAFTAPETGPTHTAVVAAAFQSDRASGAVQAFFADRFNRAAATIRVAVELGELPLDVEPIAVIRAVMAPIYFRLFISREPIDDDSLATAVWAALAAARAGVFGSTDVTHQHEQGEGR